MQVGTCRVLSTARSAMNKRQRESGPSESGGDRECPICFEKLTARTNANPFSCGHLICHTCDRRMKQCDDQRCPTCRAPRRGLTAAEAEPPADRNHDPPAIELPFELEEFIGSIANPQVLTHGVGGYGLAGQRFRRRPNTGHAMFFPVQPPSNMATMPDPFFLMGGGSGEASGASGDSEGPGRPFSVLPSDLLVGSGLGSDAEAHTVAALSSVMPHSLVQALLNLDTTPTLEDWHELVRSTGRIPARAPARRASARAPGSGLRPAQRTSSLRR